MYLVYILLCMTAEPGVAVEFGEPGVAVKPGVAAEPTTTTIGLTLCHCCSEKKTVL